ASHVVTALGFHIKATASAAGLERNAIAAHWQRVDPRSAPPGSLMFEYSPSAHSKTHVVTSLGSGRVISSSDHRVSEYGARAAMRAYSPGGLGGPGGLAGGVYPGLTENPGRDAEERIKAILGG